MGYWESSGRVKIERAKEHVENLHATAKAALEGNLYRVSIEPDTEPRQAIACIRGGPIPARWSTITADAIHNLRTALDYLWRGVWNPRGTPTRRRDQFTVFANADEFEARFRRAQQGAPQATVALLREIKPYQGGNNALYDLIRADDSDKHHTIALVCCSLSEVRIDISRAFAARNLPIPENPVLYLRPIAPHTFVPLKDGAPLGSFTVTGFEGTVQMETHLTTYVAFGESEIREGQSVVDTLNEFTGVVEGIAEALIRAGLLT